MSKDALQVINEFANLGFLDTDTDTLLAVAGEIGNEITRLESK